MSGAKHTPGPWRVSGKQSIRCESGNGYIAKTNWDNGEANARLIAAAPDLLAALEQIAILDESGPDFSLQGEDGIWRVEGRKGGKIEAIARAAIAKARGA